MTLRPLWLAVFLPTLLISIARGAEPASTSMSVVAPEIPILMPGARPVPGDILLFGRPKCRQLLQLPGRYRGDVSKCDRPVERCNGKASPVW
jgi:hypothetical protein